MNTKRLPVTVSLGLFVLILALLGGQTPTLGQALPAAVAASPVGTAFTYQGLLQGGGAPVDDDCDFEFSLWDASTGGTQVGSPQPALSIPVIDGLFAVQLDFGSGAFVGEARWLQTAVRCPAGGGTYTTLSPRQAMNPVPYAMFSQDLRLPFSKGINSPLAAFAVSNDGTGQALYASTNGSGHAVHVNAFGSGSAVAGWSFGSGAAMGASSKGTGDALGLNIDNPDNTSNLINASTNGLGAAASIRINNTLNNQPALSASTDGSGNVVHVNAFGSGSAVAGWSFGTGAALRGTSEGTGNALWLRNGNPDNTNWLIQAGTEGLGGGAVINIDNPLNDLPALQASTNGSDWAAYFRNEGSGGGVKIENLDPLNNGPALQASTVGSGWAGYFQNDGSGGGVRIESAAGTSGLSVFGGSKNAVVPTSEGARLLYTEESSEVWFTDYGFGRLAGGSVFIAIDPLFAETVNLEEPYHVFVQAYGDAELYVSQRTPEGFEVRLRAGDPDVEFSYRLVATRRGYEGKRLEHAAWAEGDPSLNPAEPAAPENGGAE